MAHDPQTQLAIAAISSWAIERMTRAAWFPVIKQESTAKVKRAFSWMVAALAGAGIGLSSTFDAGTLTVTITGLSVATVIHFLWDIVTQVAMQEGWFKVNQTVNAVGYVVEKTKNASTP